MAQRFITTPIYYVNDRPHIGHAYTTIICDVIARFWRMQGHDVRFLTGTDEHGEKIAAAAEKAGRSPKAHTDDVSRNFRHLAEACLASNDDFIRTTEPRHAETVAWFWRRLVDEQAIYLGKYVGWYAIRDEAYYTDTEVTTAANGERIAPTGAAVTWREEESYFFNLSHWTEPLLEFYAENPDFVVPRARYNEVIAFVKGGLKDLSVSRLGLDWGIPVPNSVTHRDETGKISGHSVYVWLDALVNYYTARTDATSGEAYWPPSLHVVGKDILRFHCVYWPAFLMAAKLPLPRRILAHGWWTNEGVKISKSLGNVIDPHELFATYGVDQTRYFLLREVRVGSDGDFRRDSMLNRCNAELANDWGNLVQRVLKQVEKNCDGAIPVFADPEFLAEDDAFLQSLPALLPEVIEAGESMQLTEMLEVIWQAIRDANKYVDTTAPWQLRKTDPERMRFVLYNLCEAIRRIALTLLAFMPSTSGKVLDQLGVGTAERTFDHYEKTLIGGTAVLSPQGLFPRIAPPEAGQPETKQAKTNKHTPSNQKKEG